MADRSSADKTCKNCPQQKTARHKEMTDYKLALIAFLAAFIATSFDSAEGFERRWCETYQEWCTPVAGDELEEWKDENQRISE